MKKLFLFLAMAVLMNGLIAQTTAINESFETWPAPNWNIYEMGQGGSWYHSTLWGSNLGYIGDCAKASINNDYCDNWLVSPQITVTTNDYELDFWEHSNDLQYYVYAGVYISTNSGNPADGDFVALSESLQQEDVWTSHTVDLSAYNGQDIYVAFVFQGTWHHWMVDEVIVSPSSLIDGALTAIINPVGIDPIPSTEDVIVNLHNFGTDPINDIDIEWSVNEVTQTTYQATGLSLSPGGDVALTLGQYNFASQGDYELSFNLVLSGDANPSNDTIEDTYFVTDPKDAILQTITPEAYAPVPSVEDVEVVVFNNGNFTIDNITIEWDVDGNQQPDYSISAVNLQPNESTTLNIGQYSFVGGLNTINAIVVVSGDEDLSNNAHTSYYSVGILWEGFESEVFPPEMWSADDYPLRDYFFAPPQGDYYYNSMVDDNMFGTINDTLWTPLLDISAGDSINFWVNNSAFYTNDDQLVWKDGTTGAISFMANIESNLEQWDEVTMDLSAAAGINYIGFVNNNSGSFGASSLDYITSDASIYHFSNDLGIRELTFDYLAKQDESHSFTVVLRNYGTQQVSGGDYNLVLIDESGNTIAQESGQTIDSWEQLSIDINHTFSDIENIKVHAYIDFANDQLLTNNTSVEYEVYVVPVNYQTLEMGDNDVENLMIPFNTTANDMTLGISDLSQALFYQDELNFEGYLYGLTLYYHELHGVGQFLPLEVWVKETDLADLTGGWIPTSEMQLVFADTIQVYPGYNSVYIPFDEPVLLLGNDNLAIQYFQHDPEWPYTACRFYSAADMGGPVRGIRLNDVYNLDPNDPPTYWGEHTDYSHTTFVYQPLGETGVISGTVYDENADPIEYAVVKVAGTNISENTDENGEYILPDLPYDTYDVRASYVGYLTDTQTVVLNTPNMTVDFTLQPLPEVDVFGTVYGSNAPNTPLEGVEVNLNGYENLTTTSNANGEFIFEDVFGFQDYTISYSLYGYNNRTDSLELFDVDMDLGDVILTEDPIIAYHLRATPGTDQALVVWKNPSTSEKGYLINDMDVPAHSFTNEPFEDVWLGNKFEANGLTTITSVEVLWDIYENAHDFITVDILDNKGNVIVSSEPVQTYNDSLMTIDVPNITVDGNFYAMVHWKDNPESTDALTIDFSEGIINTAYIKYPGEDPMFLSDFIGSPAGAFFVRVNTLDEGVGKSAREVLSYNIYRGLVEDMANATNWIALNTAPLTEEVFVDNTWSLNDPSEYTYAVEAVYAENDAELSFSNFIAGFTSTTESMLEEIGIYPNPAKQFVYVEATSESIIQLYNILGELMMEHQMNSDLDKLDISSLDNGTYIIQVRGKHNQLTRKLIISN